MKHIMALVGVVGIAFGIGIAACGGGGGGGGGGSSLSCQEAVAVKACDPVACDPGKTFCNTETGKCVEIPKGCATACTGTDFCNSDLKCEEAKTCTDCTGTFKDCNPKTGECIQLCEPACTGGEVCR